MAISLCWSCLQSFHNIVLVQCRHSERHLRTYNLKLLICYGGYWSLTLQKWSVGSVLFPYYAELKSIRQILTFMSRAPFWVVRKMFGSTLLAFRILKVHGLAKKFWHPPKTIGAAMSSEVRCCGRKWRKVSSETVSQDVA